MEGRCCIAQSQRVVLGDWRTCALSAKGGHLEVLQWAGGVRDVAFPPTRVRVCCWGGHLEVLHRHSRRA